jgi:DNA-binding HxlR family transcriptional regulator
MKIILCDYMLKKNNHNFPLKNILNILDNKFKFEIIYYLIQKKCVLEKLKIVYLI